MPGQTDAAGLLRAADTNPPESSVFKAEPQIQ